MTLSSSHDISFRGAVTAHEVEASFREINKNLLPHFVEWGINGIHYSVIDSPMSTLPSSKLQSLTKSVCVVSNSTAFSNVLRGISERFAALQLQTEDWIQIQEVVQNLEDTYAEAETNTE